MDGHLKETEQWINAWASLLRWASDPQRVSITTFPKQFYTKVHLFPYLSETRTQPNLNDATVHGRICPSSPRPHPLWQDAPILPPGSIEELHLCQSLCDHGGKNQAKKDTADEHIVIVVFQDIKLLGRVNSSLVNIQTVGHNLKDS